MPVLDPEARSLLAGAMVARIATVSSSGRPHVNPLYFVMDGDRIILGTATYTLAARNVRANPEVQILFEVEAEPQDRRLLRVDGTAVVSTEPRLLRRYTRRDARKYVITPRGLWNLLAHPRQWRPMRRHLRGGDACVLAATPTAADMIRDRPRPTACEPDCLRARRASRRVRVADPTGHDWSGWHGATSSSRAYSSGSVARSFGRSRAASRSLNRLRAHPSGR